jgi:hypothetical protein
VKFPCVLTRSPTGGWSIVHESPQVGRVTTAAGTRAEAIEKMRGELRYRLELCPCSGESYQHVDVEIVARSNMEPRTNN